MTSLPTLMVAPNGARLTRADHPALPVTLDQVLDTARACHSAGADGLHLHIRDRDGKHLLDAACYDEALTELSTAVPGMAVQITTESAGRYEPAFQRGLALATQARHVSVAMREVTGDGNHAAVLDMHRQARDAGVTLQYILYAPDEMAALIRLLGPKEIEESQLTLLFVLGNHQGLAGSPEMLAPFLIEMGALPIAPEWMICAFGQSETDCLLAAHALGGNLRVGFENGRWMRGGRLARSNAERVAEIARLVSTEHWR